MTVGERVGWRDRTRAERVRSRRAREERLVEPVPPEPKVKPRRAQKPRRRYDIALPAELGAEMRLPALPVIRLGVRLLTAVLLAVTALALQGVLTAPSFRVGEASVIGARLLSDSQVRSLALVDGQSVFQIDPQVVIRRLLAYPEVATAELVVRWPNRVEITVGERYPMAQWEDGGETWWISPEGIAFIQHGDWPGLVSLVSDEPMLTVSDDPLVPVVDPAILQAAAVLSGQIPDVGPLHVDPVHGLGFDDPRGWRASFGLTGDMVTRVRVYSFLVEYLTARGVHPGIISVEDVAAPYYSLERTSS